jgi:hypothetical protein
MNKLHFICGVVIGIATALFGTYVFIIAFTEFPFREGVEAMIAAGQLGKVITIGAVLNIGVFFLLLKSKKDMAWGVIAATAILAIATIFV